jgi:glycosyltransferase involved in cell wall biosynthesis
MTSSDPGVVPIAAPARSATVPVAVLLISDLEFGGAQRQVVELANHMDAGRFQVHVCALADYVPVANRLRDRDHRLHIIRKQHKFDFSIVSRLAALFRRLNAQVVHTFLFDAEFFGRLAGRMARLPAVVGSERNTDYVPKRRHVLAFALTRRWNDIIIANSGAGAAFHQKTFNVPKTKFRVIHNGVNANRFSPGDGSRLRNELGVSEGTVIAGMFASFKAQKNHPLLLQAAAKVVARVPNVRFLFVGDELYKGMSGSTEYKEQVQALVTKLGLAKHCLFVGNRENVEDYYRACDFTVLPSLFEGTPNVALESMACGVPVIATNVSDNAMVVPDAKVGFIVPSGNQDALAERIEILVTDHERRRTMARNARQWILAEFSGQRLADKTAAVYEEVLRAKTPR